MLPPTDGSGSPPTVLETLQSISSSAPLRVQWSMSKAKAVHFSADQPNRAGDPADPTPRYVSVSALDDSVTMDLGQGVALVVRGDGHATLCVPPEAPCDVRTTGPCGCAEQAHRHRCPVIRARPELRQLHQDAVIVHQLLLGRTVLHGSAVSFGGRGVAVLGAGGAGKSTTAAALCGLGGTLLSDDIVVVDHVSGTPRLLPTESRVRLITPSGGQKRGVDVATPRTSAGAADLALVVCLVADGDAGAPGWTHLQGLAAFDAVRELGAGLRSLAIQGPGQLVRGLAAIADHAEVWALRRTSTAPAPEQTAAEIRRLLTGPDPASART